VYRAGYCEVKKIWIWMNPYPVTIRMHINQTFLYHQPTLIQTSDVQLSEKETLNATINRVIVEGMKEPVLIWPCGSQKLKKSTNHQFFHTNCHFFEVLKYWNQWFFDCDFLQQELVILWFLKYFKNLNLQLPAICWSKCWKCREQWKHDVWDFFFCLSSFGAIFSFKLRM